MLWPKAFVLYLSSGLMKKLPLTRDFICGCTKRLWKSGDCLPENKKSPWKQPSGDFSGAGRESNPVPTGVSHIQLKEVQAEQSLYSRGGHGSLLLGASRQQSGHTPGDSRRGRGFLLSRVRWSMFEKRFPSNVGMRFTAADGGIDFSNAR